MTDQTLANLPSIGSLANADTGDPVYLERAGSSRQGQLGKLPSWSGKSAPAGDVVGTTDAQTLTNKTLTSPNINGGTLSDITLSDDLSVADGGTGRSSATAYALVCGGATDTGPHQSVASVGTSGQLLASNGSDALPTFGGSTGSGFVRFPNGIQIAWGSFTSSASGGGATTNFAQDFGAAPNVVATPTDDTMALPRFTVVGNETTTGFDAQTYLGDAMNTGDPSAIGGHYIAIGTWSA